MKIGVIVDGGALAAWQAEALRRLGPKTEIVVYDCRNSRPERRRLQFALYYLLNLVTVRNPRTRRAPLPDDVRVVARRPFDSEWDGAWQSLPACLLGVIRDDSPAVLVKFGMGLLRVPPAADLAIPILSYHHGAPERFRGRPAGFYEILTSEPVMGQVVQLLSNELDRGRVAARAETRVTPHSYRATLMQAYAVSPLLLEPAIRAALSNSAEEPAQRGRNYRLPGNATVLRMVAAMAWRWLARLGYGLFKEKLWRVATVEADASMASIVEALGDRGAWTDIATPSGYRFLADPFFHPGGGLLVEALDSRLARGRLLRIDGGEARVVSGRGGHFSYPATIDTDAGSFVLPEVSDWSPPLAYPITEDGLGQPFELCLRGAPRLLDPTAFALRGTIYLFGNLASEGGGVLRLWFADSIDGEFAEHPSSPIRISPDGGRMGGGIAVIDGVLVRVGQDSRGAYGDGLSFFRILRIDRESYAEEPAGWLRCNGVHGPHTLNLSNGHAVFDHYTNRLSLLAGVSRLRERRSARRIEGEAPSGNHVRDRGHSGDRSGQRAVGDAHDAADRAPRS